MAVSQKWLTAELIHEALVWGLEKIRMVMGCVSHPVFTPKQCPQSVTWLCEWR